LRAFAPGSIHLSVTADRFWTEEFSRCAPWCAPRHSCKLAKGLSAPRIAEFIPLTPQAIRKLGHRYVEGGLDRALYEKQRPGAAALLQDSEKQRIIAMVCAGPPKGYARWTVRLVAEKGVKKRLVPRVGRETIRILLLSHDLRPWLEKNVVCSGTQ